MSFSPEAARLAMSAKGWSLRRLAGAVPIDPSHLSRMLRGRRPVPAHVAAALTVLLDLDDDTARIAYVMADPRRLDAATVDALATALATQRREDDVVGPAPLVGPAERQRAALLTLLREARGPHRRALAPVVAEHVQFLGYLHTAVRNDARGVHLLTESINLADEAEDDELACQGHNFVAHVYRRHGRFGAAARHFQAGAAAPGAHPAQRVRDLARAAQALGQAGHRDDALRLLGRAEDDAAKIDNIPAPSCAYWLDEPFILLNLGLANHAVGRLDHAVGLLRDGIARFGYEGAYIREAKDVLDGRTNPPGSAPRSPRP